MYDDDHMGKRARIRLPDGSVRDLGPYEPVPEGAVCEYVRVPLAVKDGTFVNDDDDRETAFESYKRELSEAWKNPAPLPRLPAVHLQVPPATAEEAYARMVNELVNAWKEPIRWPTK